MKMIIVIVMILIVSRAYLGCGGLTPPPLKFSDFFGKNKGRDRKKKMRRDGGGGGG